MFHHSQISPEMPSCGVCILSESCETSHMDELPDLTGIPTTSAASFSSETSMSRGHSQVPLMRKQYAGAIPALTPEIPRSEKGQALPFHSSQVAITILQKHS